MCCSRKRRSRSSRSGTRPGCTTHVEPCSNAPHSSNVEASKAGGRQHQKSLLFAESNVIRAADQAYDSAVWNHNTLGTTGRPRCVHEAGQIIDRVASRQIGIGLLFEVRSLVIHEHVLDAGQVQVGFRRAQESNTEAPVSSTSNRRRAGGSLVSRGT